MKHFFPVALVAILIASSALAQLDMGSGGAQADLIKRKAMGLRDNNNQQQGVASPGAAMAPAAPAPAPLPPVTAGLSLAPQNLLDRFDNDAATFKPGATATPGQITALGNDVTALVKGATKPSKAAVAKLATDLSTGMAEKTLAAKDTLQLVKNLNVIMNSAPISAAKTQPFVTQAQTILKTAGISQTTVDAVGADLKSIVLEIQQSKPKLYQ